MSVEKTCIASTKNPNITVRSSDYAIFVQRVIASISSDPSSVETSQIITSIWPVLDAQACRLAEKDIANRCLHRDLMLATHITWNWLDDHCVSVATRLLSGEVMPDDWIVRLVKYLRGLVQNRIQQRDISPSLFSPHLPGDVYRYSVSRVNYRDAEQEDAATLKLTLDIVQHWLGFPPYLSNRLKARFVTAMVACCGPDILLLDSVWSAYGSVRRMVLTASAPNTPAMSPRIFDVFIEQLKAHPLCSVNSPHRTSFDLMARHIHLFTSDRSSIVQYIDPTTKRITYPPVEDESGLLGGLLAYLRELMPLLPGRPSLSVKNMTPLQRAVYYSPDHLLPFRERAPTRARFSGINSPFSADVVRSREGLFSALIMRGITFNTEFSRSGTMLFNNVSEWNKATYSLPISSVANIAAYGNPNDGRHPRLATGYWEATTLPVSWLTFVGSGPVSFTSCYKFFLASKPRKRFMEIGPLTAFLLAADYTYAGVVVMPSVAEVANLISKMNLGAVTGLELLRVIPKRAPKGTGPKRVPVPVCISGLARVHAYLAKHLTADEKKEFVFDVLMTEATMCKYGRASHLGLL